MNKLPEGKRFSKDYQPERTKIKKAAITREFRKRLLKDLFGVYQESSIAYKKFIDLIKAAMYDPATPIMRRAKFVVMLVDKLAPKLSGKPKKHENNPYVIKITKTKAEAMHIDEDDVETEDEYDEDEEDVGTEDDQDDDDF
jgi:hypothetical protein